MWGVGTFVGPAAGGLFAQFGLWRWAFASLTLVTLGIAAMVPSVLPRTDGANAAATGRGAPVRSLLILTAAAALVVVFVVLDRRATASVLPKAVFAGNPLKWIYLTIAVLAAASMVETFIPFFGQRLGHLIPVAAGFLGATLAFGWTVGEMISASAAARTIARVVTIAPVVVAAGLVLAGALQRDAAGALEIGLWALGFAVTGAGIGMAWPHLASAAMSVSSDSGESAAAAAAISTVQLIAGAFGAGLAGVLVNLGGSDTHGAHLLYLGFAAIVLSGVAVSSRVFRAAAGPGRGVDMTNTARESAVRAPHVGVPGV